MQSNTSRLAAALSVLSTAVAAHAQTRVVYVDQTAPAGGNGTSWPLAFNTLQAALSQVGTQATSTDLEVRIAAGIYRASSGSGFNFTPQPTNSSIVLSIKGSYMGLQSPTPNARDYVSARTTLSGDVLGNDTSNPTTWTDNIGNVLSAGLATPGLLFVDGFEIRDGRNGSGLRLTTGYSSGRISASNCDVHTNSGADGAGVMIIPSNFGGQGAAFFELFDCHIHDNSAPSGYGGAIRCSNNTVPLRLERCTIEGNSARNVGGIYAYQCSLNLTSCIIRGNVATSSLAGGIYAGNAEVTASGCLVADNSAANTTGGGINAQSVSLTNCTVAGNRASYGGGIFASRATLTNCVFFGNAGTTIGNDLYISNSLNSSHSILNPQLNAGQLPGGGYLNQDDATIWNADPHFLDPDGPDNNPQTWQDNDYRLAQNSPAIDTGIMLPGLLLLDLSGQPRLTAEIPGHPASLDMGCYEFQGPPHCPADLDNGTASGSPDGATTIEDLLFFLEHFEAGC